MGLKRTGLHHPMASQCGLGTGLPTALHRARG
jgi:hypothetical protein